MKARAAGPPLSRFEADMAHKKGEAEHMLAQRRFAQEQREKHMAEQSLGLLARE